MQLRLSCLSRKNVTTWGRDCNGNGTCGLHSSQNFLFWPKIGRGWGGGDSLLFLTAQELNEKKSQVRSVKKPLLGPENLEPRIRWQKNMVKLKKRCLSFNWKGKSMSEHVDRSLSYEPVQETMAIREYLTPKVSKFELRKTFTQPMIEPVTA